MTVGNSPPLVATDLTVPAAHGRMILQNKQQMRTNTVQEVLRAVWTSVGATRRELEAILSLSRPTVDKAIGELQRLGLVGPVGTRSLRAGRPATVFRLDGGVRVAVGVDLELPQLSFVLSDLWGEPLHQATRSVASGPDDPVPLLRYVTDELTEWLDALRVPWSRVAGVGVALPAFVSNGVANFAGEAMPAWRGVTAREALERDLPAPVHVHHDTHVMALAEARALGWTDLLYFTLRPGIHGDVRFGASLVVDGHAYRGAHGHGGSLYRAFVPGEELSCLGAKKRVALLVERAVGPLVHAVTLFDPERVVIHAEMLGADEPLFIEGCRRRLREALAGEFPDTLKVAPAQERGPTAALGAAIAVVQDLYENPAVLLASGGETGKNASGQGEAREREKQLERRFMCVS